MRQLWLLVFFSLTCLQTLPAFALEVTGLRIETTEEAHEHILLRFDAKPSAKVFAVESLPPRIAIDMPITHWRGKAALPDNYLGTFIKGVRLGYHNQSTSRIVLDLSLSATPKNVQIIGSQKEGVYWLEFDLVPLNAAKSAPVHHKANIPNTALHNTEKPIIVIDAGHGGQDPGTSGYGGAHEKDLTLRYAKALESALSATGRYHPVLTREDDHYLLLPERVKRAREAKGNLFISLHADSAPARYAHGLSVYTISEKASDKQSEALAAKENKADLIGGMDLTGTSKDVADILIDLTQRETRAKSAQFADLAIRCLAQRVHLLSHTHRFAGFAVLKAPDIPSVLIEVGFLTNPREEQQLQSAVYEHKVMQGLVKAIDAYFGKRR